MMSPHGMDELFWGCDHEDTNDQAERLIMAIEVKDPNVDKSFEIAKLNLRNKAKEWIKKLNPTPIDQIELCIWIMQKYGNINVDEIRIKLDAIKQEPKE